MIAPLGLSRPEKSRGRHFKSPSFVFFSFIYLFFFCSFFLFSCIAFVAPRNDSKGRLFRFTDTHIHTTDDRGLVVQGVLRSGVNMIYSELVPLAFLNLWKTKRMNLYHLFFVFLYFLVFRLSKNVLLLFFLFLFACILQFYSVSSVSVPLLLT